MSVLLPVDYPSLLATLVGQGVAIRAAGSAPALAGELQRHADGTIRVAYDRNDPDRIDGLAAVLQARGLVVERLGDDGMQILGRRQDHNQLLAFELPIRLPSLNPQLRTHWSTKGKKLKELAWEIHAAVPPRIRPRTPLENIEVEIDRYATNEPDEENLKASAKWLLDVMQPMHPSARPYGLGIIREDAKWCLRALRVKHVASSKALTVVRIYRSVDKEA
jgi:hypothetical protein